MKDILSVYAKKEGQTIQDMVNEYDETTTHTPVQPYNAVSYSCSSLE